MKLWWASVSEKINAKNQRERCIIGLMALALIYAVFDFAVISGIESEKDKLHSRIKLAESEQKKLSAQELVLAQAITNDPNAQKKLEIKRLGHRIKELDDNLQKLSVGLIPANKLPTALQAVLESLGTLELKGMRTLEPSQLQLQSQYVDENTVDDEESALQIFEEEETENVGVFKHSVIVSLEGRYFDVVNYLNALENLPWKIYWESVDYEVTKYPKARISIEVYTLSTEQGVLGV